MRTRNDNGVISVRAISGTRVVLLGLDLKGYDPPPPKDSSLPQLMSNVNLNSKNESPKTKKNKAKVKNGNAPFLGFSITRTDVETQQTTSLNVDGKPIQKFLWGDYDVQPGREYEYTIRQMTNGKGFMSFMSTKLVSYGQPLQVRITTEDPTKGTHGIYFNRGVAGSKAYNEKFEEYRRFKLVSKYGVPIWRNVINPRDMEQEKSKEALAWLSRGLEEALLDFLSQAKGSSFQIRAAVYEFTHKETLQALADAVERGVDVKIIRHCKGVFHPKVKRNDIVKDEHGNVVSEWVPDSTTDEASKAIRTVGFRSLDHAQTWHHSTFIERKHSSALMHNKFIILVDSGTPTQVWTGSANFTDGGIYGQANVGHIVRDYSVAKQYLSYWNALKSDPPGRSTARSHSDNDDESTASGEEEIKRPMDDLIEEQQPDLDGPLNSNCSMKTIFSPRKTANILQFYADRMRDAKSCIHLTAPFGVSQEIAQVLNETKRKTAIQAANDDGLRRSPRIARRDTDLAANETASAEDSSENSSLMRYVLFDKKPSEHSSDKARASAAKKGEDYVDYFDFKDLKENRVAYGAVLEDQTGVRGEDLTGLTTFVDFIHLKVLLIDSIEPHPTVITGSANFSTASTINNDENMLVIPGDCAVADVYFTEYMRLFQHFYSRDNQTKPKELSPKTKKKPTWGETVGDESWLQPYFDPTNQLCRERLLFR